MKFKTHNDKIIETNSTSLVGVIKVPYYELIKMFGEPMGGDGDKTDAEWEIEFEDGTIATIYNWKDGKNYNGDSGIPTEKITNWHIGGFTAEAKYNVLGLFTK